MKKFQYKSVMQIPTHRQDCHQRRLRRLQATTQRLSTAVVKDITAITGQKAVVTKARKSVANFKLREGMHVGVKVTLRHDTHVGVPRQAA